MINCLKVYVRIKILSPGLYYYKCRTTGCKHNVSAKKIHNDFANLVSLFQLDKENLPLVEQSLTFYFDAFFEEHKNEKALIEKNIKELEKKIDKMEERHAIGEIDSRIFNKFHKQYESELTELLIENEKYLVGSSNLKKCLKKALKICLNPRLLWESKDFESKLKLQNILFPDGISISKQNKEVRTNRLNSIFVPILELAKVLRESKNGQPIKFDKLSALVTL